MDIDHILLMHGQVKEKKNYKIYGVAIDLNNSNPNTSVSYTDDAVVMLPHGSWDNVYPFNSIKPVLLNGNGEETAQLDKNDFGKDIYGNPVNITDGDNVMIKIPKVWYKIETIGDFLHVKISDKQVDDTFKCYAHSDGHEEREAFYVGAYLAYNQNNVLKSWSGKIPTSALTFANTRNYARANGFRYNLLGFYQLMLLQVLQLIRCKSLDSQRTYGRAISDLTDRVPTGETDTKGLYYGDVIYELDHVKIMGIEDFYGNLRCWIDGVRLDAEYNLLTTKNPSLFNNAATGYDLHVTSNAATLNGYSSKVQGDTERGFVTSETLGSSSTFFCDNARLTPNAYLQFSSSYDSGNSNGAYAMRFENTSGNGSASVGTRIMYL